MAKNFTFFQMIIQTDPFLPDLTENSLTFSLFD